MILDAIESLAPTTQSQLVSQSVGQDETKYILDEMQNIFKGKMQWLKLQ